jgi:hypothetical protein
MTVTLNRILLFIVTLSATATPSGTVLGQNASSPAYGSVQLTIPGGTLAAVSATLGNELVHVSAGTVNDDWTASPAEQTITLDDADCATDQWISAGPHLAYVSDASGNEEAFLILGNTEDEITIQAGFDLLDEDRDIPGATSVAIRRAHTFVVSMRYPAGTTVGELGFENLPGWQAGSGGDTVLLWNGTGWTTYWYQTNSWRRTGSFLAVDDDPVEAHTAVFVDRGSQATLEESANVHPLPYAP